MKFTLLLEIGIISLLVIILIVDGNPTQELNSGVAYDEYDGSFVVDQVVSNKEFTYKLNAVAAD